MKPDKNRKILANKAGNSQKLRVEEQISFKYIDSQNISQKTKPKEKEAYNKKQAANSNRVIISLIIQFKNISS